MKEYIYQGIIGVLLLVSTFAFYSLYKKDTSLLVTTVLPLNLKKSVNIASEKAIYKNIKAEEIMTKQTQNFQSKKILLNVKLNELQKSTIKSIEMIESYKNDNQNNQVFEEVNLDSLNEQEFELKELSTSPNYSALVEKIQALQSKYEEYENQEEKEITSNIDSSNNTSDGSFTNSSFQSNTAINKDSSTSEKTIIVNKTLPENSSTTTEIKEDKELLTYQNSINNIALVIKQLNKNLE